MQVTAITLTIGELYEESLQAARLDFQNTWARAIFCAHKQQQQRREYAR